MAEQKVKKIDELDGIDRLSLLTYFRSAVRARQAQWDNESGMEELLGREVEVDIAGIASCCSDPSALTLDTLREALGE